MNKIIVKKIKKLFLKSRKGLRDSSGSAMVESAIYFPMVLLGAMFTIYMMINMYSAASFQSKMNKEIRAESISKIGNAEAVISSSKSDDKYRKAAEKNKIKTSEGKNFLTSYVYGSGSIEQRGETLTRFSKKRAKYSARSYCIDEKNYIWDLF